MAKPNYQQEKRKKEVAKKQKAEAKRLSKLEKKNQSDQPEGEEAKEETPRE